MRFGDWVKWWDSISFVRMRWSYTKLGWRWRIPSQVWNWPEIKHSWLFNDFDLLQDLDHSSSLFDWLNNRLIYGWLAEMYDASKYIILVKHTFHKVLVPNRIQTITLFSCLIWCFWWKDFHLFKQYLFSVDSVTVFACHTLYIWNDAS